MKPKKSEAIAELWLRGKLKYKCHPLQKEMYDIFHNAPEHSTLVWLVSRQTGKSVALAILALEQCLSKKNSVVKLLCDTKLHVKSIFLPIFNMLLEDCPEELKPSYLKNDYSYVFKNGSRIELAGSDGGHFEKLRGQRSDMILIDEAGFCNELEEVVKSVLLPTTTHTGGKIVLSSTPPPDLGHDFFKFVETAEMNGTLTKKTIYDNPLLTKEKIDMLIKEMGGVNNPKFKREYLCITNAEDSLSVFPEFTKELEAEIVKEWNKPPHYDAYVSMDLGYKDLTAVLFGYYDYRAGKLIVEDEIVLEGKDVQLPRLAEAILKKEADLWTDIYTNELRKPTLRVSDINHIVTSELHRISLGQLSFSVPRKDDNESAINNLRVMLSNQKIIIHPRCKFLIRHLRNCKWRERTSKSQFGRSPDNGHYDTVDALKYMSRHINYNKNPYPRNYNISLGDTYVQSPSSFYSSQANDPREVFSKIFGKKR